MENGLKNFSFTNWFFKEKADISFAEFILVMILIFNGESIFQLIQSLGSEIAIVNPLFGVMVYDLFPIMFPLVAILSFRYLARGEESFYDRLTVFAIYFTIFSITMGAMYLIGLLFNI